MMKKTNKVSISNKLKSYAMESQLIYGKMSNPKWDYDHQLVPPISSSTTFKLDSAERGAEGFKKVGQPAGIHDSPIYIYDRLGEPNKSILEEHLAYSENGECCVTFATGMAAISAVLCVLTKSGDEIIAHKALYGCTFSLLENWMPRFKVNVKFADLRESNNLRKTISKNTKVIYFETPINPTLELVNIKEIRKIVDDANKKRSKNNKISIVIDNTFATPFCQRPLNLGADFVVHSLTKNIGGFGTDMGGAIIGPSSYESQILLFRKDFGSVLNSKSAWAILVHGIPTLSLRLLKQQKSAMKIATFLSEQSQILEVNYPGLETFKQHDLAKKQMYDYEGNFAPGSMIYFVVKGKDPQTRQKAGRKLIDFIAQNAYTITLAVSLGNIRTLIEHPGSMTHSAIPPALQLKSGMDPGGIRLSIGLENADDIINDLKKGLKILQMIIGSASIFSRFDELKFFISTKCGGVSPPPYFLNLSFNVNDSVQNVERNRKLFFGTINVKQDDIAFTTQIHSDIVTVVQNAGIYPNCDGLITNKNGLFLSISIADCVPIFLYDCSKHIIAAVHSGWRGSKNKIILKAIKVMEKEFCSYTKDIFAYIGYSASKCCYEVGSDVAFQFGEKYYQRKDENKFLLDIKSFNHDILTESGVPKEQIETSEFCTICNPNFLHSYRRDGKNAGRMFGVIGMNSNKF